MPIQDDPVTGIRIINASLDEFREGSATKIILRGVLEPDHFGLLKVDDYQRAKFAVSEQSSIWKALKTGEALPDIELGMRGQNFVEVPDTDDIVLRDPTYLIDGLQRVTHAMAFLEKNAKDVRLGATVHLGTTRPWELERFRALNTARKRVSPNVLLRNLRESYPAVLSIYGLCNNTPDFPLYKRVSWGQNMVRGDLLTGMAVAVSAVYLHRHVGTVVAGRGSDDVASSVTRIADRIGMQQMRENLLTFFQLIEQTWGLRSVQYGRAACWLRNTFLWTLAEVLSNHTDFWDEEQKVLTISADLKRKIGMFPVQDPAVVNLAGSSGGATKLLYSMMLDHINSGKRTGRLTHRLKLADDIERKRDERNQSDEDHVKTA